MNNVVLSGRLAKDPELRVKAGNDPLSITRFTLAVEGGKKDEVHYIPCVCFAKTAEALEKYVKKGDKIFVAGTLTTSSYKDKEGNTKWSWNVNVAAWEFGPAKKTAEAEAPTEALPFE